MLKGIKLAVILSLTSTTVFANPKTICGDTDDRIASNASEIGRVSIPDKNKGCTFTMISKSCAITAGHCSEYLEVASFNVPESVDYVPRASKPEDMYEVIPSSVMYQDDGPGKDWAVMKLRPNSITGQYPGDVQGFMDVQFTRPKRGSMIRITGYGRDNDTPEGNFAQQTHAGQIKGLGGFFGAMMSHVADTMGGNSGSAIVSEDTGKIVGIHTHGGCTSTGGSNKSTVIAKHQELIAAIKLCLKLDRQ